MTCISSSIRSILVVESRPDVSAPCRQSVDAEIPASLGLPSVWVDSPLMCTRGCDVCNRGRNAEYPSLRTCVSGYRGKIEREQRKDRRKNETATATLPISQASCRRYSRGDLSPDTRLKVVLPPGIPPATPASPLAAKARSSLHRSRHRPRRETLRAENLHTDAE